MSLSCAPPNAVYGIETHKHEIFYYLIICSCAPPNAVYGIETFVELCRSRRLQKIVVRRLMPFTALKHFFALEACQLSEIVVRRLMPFTASKK